MELWVPITILAAFFQNLRSVLQKSLQGSLGTRGATYVRFLYGLPVAVAYLAGVVLLRGDSLPAFGGLFVFYTVAGGLAQILATAALLASFRSRNFAAGVAYAKTEPIQAALFGFVVLGDAIPALGFLAILLGLLAVLVLTVGMDIFRRDFWVTGLHDRAALFGVLAGAGFGIAAVFYRGAGLALPHGDFILRSAFTLACTLVFQTVAMTLEILWAERGLLRAVFAQWRRGALVGLVSVVASAGWFAAGVLHSAAYVRAVGQVELVFAAASSVLIFREKLEGREIVGMLLLVASIVLLVTT